MANENRSNFILSAEDKSRAAFDSFNKNVVGVTPGVSALTGKLLGFGAAVVGVGSAFDGLKNAVNDLAALDDMTQKTGASVENLSKFQKIAKQFGGDFSAVDTSLVKLAKGMATVDDATNKTNGTLKKLGISNKDSNGNLRDSGDVLVEVAKKLQNYQDSTSKAALLQDMLGKSGAQLLPYLNDLAENYDKTSGASAQSAARAAAFQDQLGYLKIKADEAFQSIAEKLLPSLNQLVDSFIKNVEQSGLLLGTMKSIYDLGELVIFGTEQEQRAERMKTLVTDINNIEQQLGTAGKVNNSNKSRFPGAALSQEDVFRLRREAFDKSLELAQLARQQERAKPSSPYVSPNSDKPTLNYTSGGEADAAAAATKLTTAYDALINKTNDYITTIQYENQTSQKLSDGQKRLNDLTQFLADNTGKLTAARVEAINQKINEVSVQDNLAKVIKDEAHWRDVMAAATEREIDATNALNDALQAEIDTRNEKLSTLANDILRREEDLNAALIYDDKQRVAAQMQLDHDREIARIQALEDGTAETHAAIEAQINDINRLYGKEIAVKQRDEFKTTFNAIENTAHATWISIFDSGKSVFDRLRDTLKNGLLEVLWQMTAKKWFVSIGASIAGGASGAALAGDGSSGGVSISPASLLSSGANLFGGAFGSGLSFASNAGLVEAFKAGASTLFSGGLGGGGALSSLGAMAPGIGIAISALSLASSFMGEHVSRPKYYANSLVNQRGTTLQNAYGNSDAGSSQVAVQANDSVGKALLKYVDAFKGTISKSFTLGSTYQQKYDLFAFSVGKDIQKNAVGADFQFGATENVNAAAQVFFLSVKKNLTQLADYQEAIIKRSALPIDQANSNVKRLDYITQLYQSLDDLPPVFDAIRDTIDKFTKLSKASMQTLRDRVAATNNFVDLFYSDSEKLAIQKQQLSSQFASLNLVTPDSAQAFRALVEGVDTSTKSGLSLYDSLLGLAPAFDSYIDKLTQQRDLLKDISSDRFSNIVDFNVAKARIGAGLPVSLPSFDVGTNYVPTDMVAQIHKGERIIPAADNRELMNGMRAGTNTQLNALISDLIREVKTLATRNSSENVAANSKLLAIAKDIQQMNREGVIVRAVDANGDDQVVPVRVVA